MAVKAALMACRGTGSVSLAGLDLPAIPGRVRALEAHVRRGRYSRVVSGSQVVAKGTFSRPPLFDRASRGDSTLGLSSRQQQQRMPSRS